MDYAHESFTNVKTEIKPLLDEHWKEIALHQDDIKLEPNWEGYAKLADQGALRIYTAREKGALKGYFVVIVMPSLHYSRHLFANNDILFLKKTHRKGTTGIKLIKYAVEDLKAYGVKLININVKKKQDFGVVLEHMEFEHVEDMWQLKVN
ncbi:MAG: hypothetical protein Unbinned2819contig1003_40 [Prokaryotic dsDNA virus sp.]|nr:MAG: hypothetical protein Unbinned2819contig1003_40 [Prokaryotic dsDNA virus sp.]|tara:strand:- start:25297 stop:25746 length:450 start_codon:yes stop_codon:yes gene_type:complete